MQVLATTLILALLAGAAQTGAASDRPQLRFAWPARASALIELTDRRSVGDSSREIRIEMRLTVAPDAETGGLLLRFSDARIVSVDGRSPRSVGPESLDLAAARVLRVATPDFVVSRSGDFVECRELLRTVGDVRGSAGLPETTMGAASFAALVREAAASDWTSWAEVWSGDRLAPGEWTRTRRDMDLDGRPVEVEVVRRGLDPSGRPGCERFRLSTEYPSAVVRSYTSGFLIDMAREAKELEMDVATNTRFLDRATYGPMTEELTAELEAATLRPISIERVRRFSATAGRHRVEGVESRVHRFSWEPDRSSN